MKVLFNHHLAFSLVHGGTQILIEQIKKALEQLGVQVEPLRWYEDTQKADILQHFGRIPTETLRAAHLKGMKVAFADQLTAAAARPVHRLKMQKYGERFLRKVLPKPTIASLGWDSYWEADAIMMSSSWEAHLVVDLFRAPVERVHIVLNGAEDVFFNSKPQPRGEWLVCTAAITPRKRVLEAAEAAVAARTPLWVVGNPYSSNDPYAQRFIAFAREHRDLIRYEGGINDRATLANVYRRARGFVLLSTMESLSLSALEAAACECPLLLSDLPWATWTFKEKATYCGPDAPLSTRANILRAFYDKADTLARPDKPFTWLEIGQQMKNIYEKILSSK
jgi:glycosyltransferase involved in cell wall biosynthesis